MAKAALKNVALTPQFQGQARLAGGFYVYQAGTTTQATVSDVQAGTNTITQPIPYSDYTAQVGWVDPGEYTLSANSYTQDVDVTAGDQASNVPISNVFVDQGVAAQNFAYNHINSASVSRTSQLAAFVKMVATSKLTISKVFTCSSGTAAATITNTYVGVYTTDGTTLTRQSVNATNTTSGLWDSTNTAYRQAITPTTQIIYPGQTFFVGLLVNATTAGTLFGFVKTASLPALASTELTTPPMYTLAAQTSLPTTQLISGLTAAYDLVPWVAVQ